MNNYLDHPILGPLGNQMFRRLEFRYGPFKDTIRGIQNRSSQEGLARSGALVRRLITAFRNEAQERLDVIEKVLRAFRSSCSPKEIVALHKDLNHFIKIIMKQTLIYAGNDCRSALGSLLESFGPEVKKVFDAELLGCEANCLGLMDGIIDEIVMAARTDLRAIDDRDRPNYSINNQFSGPIASVAQGNSSVANVSQVISSTTPSDIADAISKVVAALGGNQTLRPETQEAVSALAETQTELLGGRIQVGKLARAMDVLSKAEDVALRAPEVAGRLHDLLQMIGLVS